MTEALQVVALCEWMTGRLPAGVVLDLYAVARPHGWTVAVAQRADLSFTAPSGARSTS